MRSRFARLDKLRCMVPNQESSPNFQNQALCNCDNVSTFGIFYPNDRRPSHVAKLGLYSVVTDVILLSLTPKRDFTAFRLVSNQMWPLNEFVQQSYVLTELRERF